MRRLLCHKHIARDAAELSNESKHTDRVHSVLPRVQTHRRHLTHTTPQLRERCLQLVCICLDAQDTPPSSRVGPQQSVRASCGPRPPQTPERKVTSS